nr:hypothetical protein CFP56_30057 [Quercus suber]
MLQSAVVKLDTDIVSVDFFDEPRRHAENDVQTTMRAVSYAGTAKLYSLPGGMVVAVMLTSGIPTDHHNSCRRPIGLVVETRPNLGSGKRPIRTANPSPSQDSAPPSCHLNLPKDDRSLGSPRTRADSSLAAATHGTNGQHAAHRCYSRRL